MNDGPLHEKSANSEQPERPERPENSEGQVVMPFYIVCDVSGSMHGDMNDLADGLRQLHNGIMEAPLLDDLVMLSVITFNDQASTLVPLASPSDITLPSLPPAGGLTEYSAALQEFHRAFQADLVRLKSEGKQVYRPCIFFLTDGEPNNDSYKQTFQSILAREHNRAYPYVCAFGFRDAKQPTMESLAYPNFGEENKRGRWFIAKQGHSVSELLSAMAGTIKNSILLSGNSAASGSPQRVPPAPARGWVDSIVD